MPVHQATADENAEHRALGQRLRFSNFGYDEGGSYEKSIENIIPHVNGGLIWLALLIVYLLNGQPMTCQVFGQVQCWTAHSQQTFQNVLCRGLTPDFLMVSLQSKPL